MATGVEGRQEYGGTETVWCDLDGGLVSVEIRRSDMTTVLYSPAQARELAKVLQELADEADQAAARVDDSPPPRLPMPW